MNTNNSNKQTTKTFSNNPNNPSNADSVLTVALDHLVRLSPKLAASQSALLGSLSHRVYRLTTSPTLTSTSQPNNTGHNPATNVSYPKEEGKTSGKEENGPSLSATPPTGAMSTLSLLNAATVAATTAAVAIKSQRQEERLFGRVDELSHEDIKYLSKLGEGSFGVVWRGEVWGQPVAIKKIKANRLADANSLKEFRKEIAILRTIRHPNIIEFLGVCEVRSPDIRITLTCT